MVDEGVVIIEVAGVVVAMVVEITTTTTTIMVVNLMVALTFLMQVVNRIKITMEVHGLMGGFKYTIPLTGLLPSPLVAPFQSNIGPKQPLT